MRKLFSTVCTKKSYLFLLALCLLGMCLLTFASQFEIFALGIITKKGPEFFELFAPLHQGQLTGSNAVSFEDIQQRYHLIANTEGYITRASAEIFLSEFKKNDIISRGIGFINYYFAISDNAFHLAYLLIFVALFKAITLFIHRFSTRLVAIKISRDLRQDYFEHLQSLPMTFYQQQNIGGLSSRVVADAFSIAEAINACLVNYIQTPFTIVTTLILCFLTSWQLSMIIFFGFPLIVFPIVFLAKRVKRISKEILKNQERFAAVLVDFIAGIQTIKVFAMEPFSLKKFREQNFMLADLEKKSARYDLSSRPIVHTIGMFFLAFALIWGLYFLQMSVSEVLFYCGMLYIFYEPIKKFAEENSHIQRGIAAAERMHDVMEIKPAISDEDGAMELPEWQHTIEFDNVWFAYDDTWVLKNLSFTIRKGEVIAICGPTGAGKSTIAQLLPRLYDVQKGQIRIDGIPITRIKQQSLRELIAYVPQKPFLFLDTIAENISFGRSFSLEEIKQAATNAHADEFICSLPQGYHTILAEAGKNLSGGQQQRLAIARALCKKASILLLDEATSSLDGISETKIKDTCRSLRNHYTQIVIAHRLSTIEDADRIFYMENGEIVATGTKDELLATCMPFKALWLAHQGKKNQEEADAEESSVEMSSGVMSSFVPMPVCVK